MSAGSVAMVLNSLDEMVLRWSSKLSSSSELSVQARSISRNGSAVAVSALGASGGEMEKLNASA